MNHIPHTKTKLSRFPFLFLFCLVLACSKSNDGNNNQFTASLSFQAGTGIVQYPRASVTTESINNVTTTLITGQYADTSSKQGSISIRVIGDSTLQYKTPNVLVTFTDSTGRTWTNTADTTNTVSIYRFDKTPNGQVHGSFSCTVTNQQGNRLLLDKGNFTAPYAY